MINIKNIDIFTLIHCIHGFTLTNSPNALSLAVVDTNEKWHQTIEISMLPSTKNDDRIGFFVFAFPGESIESFVNRFALVTSLIFHITTKFDMDALMKELREGNGSSGAYECLFNDKYTELFNLIEESPKMKHELLKPLEDFLMNHKYEIIDENESQSNI